MFLTSFSAQQFRCFERLSVSFDKRLILIEGLNGAGKTSLLEAIHYLCYLRSFRTHIPYDMLKFGNESFFVRAEFKNTLEDVGTNEIQVGLEGKKRLVKVNQKTAATYKEVLDHYRVVTLTEDDLFLIKGGPEVRRSFIDQLLLLQNPAIIPLLKQIKAILEQRNMLLRTNAHDVVSYDIWTYQLWEKSLAVVQARTEALAQLESQMNQLFTTYFDATLSATITYQAKNMGNHTTYEAWQEHHTHLYEQEKRFGRSLFGAHLDDFAIAFQDKRSRAYASRGQQKLLIVLLKIAQVKLLLAQKGSAIFLLDDFMTDFDPQRAKAVLPALMDLPSQLIFTSPGKTGVFEEQLLAMGAQHIKL